MLSPLKKSFATLALARKRYGIYANFGKAREKSLYKAPKFSLSAVPQRSCGGSVGLPRPDWQASHFCARAEGCRRGLLFGICGSLSSFPNFFSFSQWLKFLPVGPLSEKLCKYLVPTKKFLWKIGPDFFFSKKLGPLFFFCDQKLDPFFPIYVFRPFGDQFLALLFWKN